MVQQSQCCPYTPGVFVCDSYDLHNTLIRSPRAGKREGQCTKEGAKSSQFPSSSGPLPSPDPRHVAVNSFVGAEKFRIGDTTPAIGKYDIAWCTPPRYDRVCECVCVCLCAKLQMRNEMFNILSSFMLWLLFMVWPLRQRCGLPHRALRLRFGLTCASCLRTLWTNSGVIDGSAPRRSRFYAQDGGTTRISHSVMPLALHHLHPHGSWCCWSASGEVFLDV